MRPTAKSLVLDLLSTLRTGTMPVRALVAAAELFGIDGNALRVALARLVSEGVVESDERGAYRLGAGAASISAHVTSWRTIEERVRAWDGGWIGALTAPLPRSERSRMRSSERALKFLGFRDLDRGMAVRPDNLKGGTEAVRARLLGLGLDEHVAVMRIVDLDPRRDEHARTLWDGDDLAHEYRDLLGAVERSMKRLAELPPKRAMAESFLLGGATIRAIVLDPLLPEPMAPVAERRALIAAMREYDRLGRQCWAPFMKEHAAPALRTPHDVRATETSWPEQIGTGASR